MDSRSSDLRRRNLTLDALGVTNFSDPQVIRGLQVQPRARIAAKVASQPHRRVRSDGTPLAHDVIDARRGTFNAFAKAFAYIPSGTK